MDMNFNGFTVSQLFRITDVKVQAMPSVNVKTKTVPARHGTIFQGMQLGERTITVNIALIKDYWYQTDDNGVPKSSEFNNYLRSIIYYLQTDEPKKLIFSDEPDRYYWAICTGIDVNRLLRVGTGTITFKCTDPYMYAVDERTFNFTDVGSSIFSVDNYGTVEAFPKIKVTMSGDAHYLACVSPEGVVQLGVMEDESTTTSTLRSYRDDLPDLSNWYVGSQALCPPGGSITDYIFDSDVSATSNGEVMRPTLTKYEEGSNEPKDYKGTLMMTTLPTNTQSKYFQARLQFDFETTAPNQCGVNEIILYDVNNVIIGRFSFRDYNPNLELTQPFAYLGARELIWKPTITAPKPTTKKYRKVFESEDELPTDANLVNKYERVKNESFANVDVANAPIHKYSVVAYKNVKQSYTASERYYDKKAKKYKYRQVTKYKSVKVENPMMKASLGTRYRVKSTKSGWVCIYLNSARTKVGWIQTKYVTVTKEEMETVYVYERKIYTTKAVGSYCNWWGYWMVTRKPHSNGRGDIWVLELYRLNKTTGKARRLWYKQLSDKTGTKYTTAGNLAKVGVFMGAYGNNEVMTDLSFNYMYIKPLDKNYKESDYHIIAEEGDVIEIDYSIPSVELNGEPILYEVDIGSQFHPIQPFMNSEIQLLSDAGFDAEVTIRERYL